MHKLFIGQTRTGKSTELKNEVLKIQNGFFLADPHGDLAEWAGDTFSDCIFFDPTEIPIGLNLLHDVPRQTRHLVAEDIVSAIKAVWASSWGANLEDVLRNAVLLLLDNTPNTSLVDLIDLLSDREYRAHLLKRCANEAVRNFWAVEFPHKSERQQADELRSTQNKVRQFAIHPTLRAVLGAHRTLNLDRIMTGGRKLVVNLSKGKLGEAPSHLLGALLVSAFYAAALRRATIPEHERRPFTLVIDEFQNFATETFGTILSEAGKYGLSLYLAHQHLLQTPEQLRYAVLGNVHSITCFRVAPRDAEILSPILDVHPSQLTDLPNYEAWTNYHHPPDPQLIKTRPPEVAGDKLAAVKRQTLDRYLS